MSQIKKSSLALAALLSLFVMALSGCGDRKSQASLDPISGKHIDRWLPSGHKETARANIAACTDCHGLDLNGGISKVSCTLCHLGNAFSVHPVIWGHFAYAFHAGFVETSPTGSASCAVASCHGTDLLGGAGSGPSCAVNCHMAGTAQAPQKHAWLAETTAENITGHVAYFAANPIDYTTCRNNACHGGAGTTAPPPGVFVSGPSCLGLGCHDGGNPLPPEP